MISRKISIQQVVRTQFNWGLISLLLLAILLMMGACSDDEGTSQPQTPNPGNIEVKIETDGKDDDPDGYVVLVDGSGLETEANGTYTVANKSPGTYSVELTGVPAHCEEEGEMVRQVVVAADGTIQVDFKVTCKAVLRNKILYAKGPRFSEEFGIYKMDLNGENQELLYSQGVSHPTSLAVSPDGTTVYFNTHEFGTGAAKIFKMNADGEEVEEIFDGMYLNAISLSPDGTRLAFRMGLDFDIYVLNLETQNLNRITNEPDISYSSPSWNADGSKIVVTKQDQTSEIAVSIWEMNVDGSDPKQILGDVDYSFSSAHLSPKDDESIVFVSFNRHEVPRRREIHMGDRELGERKNISELVGEPATAYSSPRWSSDANHILFLSQFQIHNYQIYSYDVEKEEIIQLTSEVAMHLNAIFSPIMRH